MTIGEAIRIVRRQKGLTQKDLADRIGISYVNISRIESGRRTPSFTTVSKIADALGTTASKLAGISSLPEDTVKKPDSDGDMELEFIQAGDDKEKDSADAFIESLGYRMEHFLKIHNGNPSETIYCFDSRNGKVYRLKDAMAEYEKQKKEIMDYCAFRMERFLSDPVFASEISYDELVKETYGDDVPTDSGLEWIHNKKEGDG